MMANKQGIATVTSPKIQPLRVGVVGAGNMGQHHLRFYSMLNSAKLVAVVDVDEQKAKTAAAKYHCEAYTHLEDLIGKVDAVSIAVPSEMHGPVGEFLLRNHIHCLIEKPLAISEADCLKLIKTAESKGVILLVGHVEYFNPAVQTLAKLLKEAGQIFSLEAKRMNWNTHARIPGVDVILDLMVHDLQIISFLQDDTVINLAAQGFKFQHLTRDILEPADNAVFEQASCLLSYRNGATANLTASWVSAHKLRALTVNTEMGTFNLDYSTQNLSLYRRPPLPAYPAAIRCEANIEQLLVRHQEPLMLELQNFLQSIDAGIPLGVDGYQAMNALKLAWKIQAALTEQAQTEQVQSRETITRQTEMLF